MSKLLLTTAVLAFLATPAFAQRAGTYAVAGQSPNGQRYEGMATLVDTGPGTWNMTWRIGSDVSEGVGLTRGPVFMASYVLPRGGAGVVAYIIDPDGRLRGTWTQRGGGIGTEILTPVDGR